jgi:hypothetical protein
MKQQMPGTDPAKPVVTARVIHGAVMAGIVIIFAVFLYLFGSGVARGRIPPRRRGEDLAEWWAANLNGAVVVWVLAEGGGLGAMALGWLTGDTNLLALGAAVALAVLFVNRPSRFQGET